MNIGEFIGSYKGNGQWHEKLIPWPGVLYNQLNCIIGYLVNVFFKFQQVHGFKSTKPR